MEEKKNAKKEEVAPDLEGIKRVLLEEQQIRQERCGEKIRLILEEEKCIVNFESKMVKIAPGIYQVQAGMKIICNA